MTTTNIQAGTRMTLEEFLALPEMDQPCELIDGVVYMAARPIPDHQFLATILSSILVQQIVEIGLGIVLYEPGVVLSSNTAVAPDITVIRSDRTGIIGPTVIDGAPDIVAEVLSSNRNHDLVTKRRHYEARGIPEYWIIDAVADTLDRAGTSGWSRIGSGRRPYVGGYADHATVPGLQPAAGPAIQPPGPHPALADGRSGGVRCSLPVIAQSVW